MKKDEWIDRLADELGLTDTVPPEVTTDDETMSIVEAIRTITFTPKGWANVRSDLLKMASHNDPALWRSIMENRANFKVLMGIILIPYELSKALGYSEHQAEQVALLTSYALALAMQKGYNARQNMEGPRAQGGEGSGDAPKPE